MNNDFHCLYPLSSLPRDRGDVRGGSFDVFGCDVATLGSLGLNIVLPISRISRAACPSTRANIFLEQFRAAFKIIRTPAGAKAGLMPCIKPAFSGGVSGNSL